MEDTRKEREPQTDEEILNGEAPLEPDYDEKQKKAPQPKTA